MCLGKSEMYYNNRTQDKENVPPSFAQKPTRKQKRFNICNNVNKTRGKWANEALEGAMDVVEGGITSLRKASRPIHSSYLIV
jgi:hypothetical protein